MPMPSTLLLCMAGYSLSLESLLVQFLPGLPAKGSDGQTVSNFAMIFLTTWVRSIGTVFGCVETIRKVNVCSSLLTFLHQEPVRRIKALHGCGQGKPIMFRYKFYLPDCLRLDCLLDCWVPFSILKVQETRRVCLFTDFAGQIKVNKLCLPRFLWMQDQIGNPNVTVK